MASISQEPENNDIELLKDESGGLMMEEGITTISFYNGNFHDASTALRAQFALVVAKNRWLAGRLVKAKSGVVLRQPANPSAQEIDAIFTATSADATGTGFKLIPTSPYTQICTEIYTSKKVTVESGSSLVDKNKPIAILTLAESVKGEFALIFSLSHAVADGRTYYEILKMLQPGAVSRELQTTRVMSFSESMRDKCGRKEIDWADSPSTNFMYTVSMLPAMLECGKKVTCHAFNLDDERLAATKLKEAKDGGVPYVTTNDILTSGFFNECGSRIGMMGFDCREKIDGVSADLAGNYVTALILDPDVFATPATLRKMYSSTPYKTTERPLSGCCGCADASFAMVTNWSSFAGGLITLEGCELVIHLPVQNPVNCVYDLMIPFSSGVGKKGVICWTLNSDEEGLRKALPVGECVSKELFP
jgi:hypothetical protein